MVHSVAISADAPGQLRRRPGPITRAGIGILGALAAAYADSSLELRVMTFNVQQPAGTNWDARKDKAAAILSGERPDVAGTQEAVAAQRDYLAAHAPSYAWYGLGRDGGDNGEGSWIFYRTERLRIDSLHSGNIWLSNTPGSPSRLGGSYNRICTYARFIEKATGRGFYVFNSHFYTLDQAEYRMASARMLVKAMAARAITTDPVIATGDFNSPEGDAVTEWFKHGSDNPIRLRDTYRDYDPTGAVTTGFGVKFDYVYVPDAAAYATLKAWVVTNPAGASDHMPTVSEVRIEGSVTRIVPGASRSGRASKVDQYDFRGRRKRAEFRLD